MTSRFLPRDRLLTPSYLSFIRPKELDPRRVQFNFLNPLGIGWELLLTYRFIGEERCLSGRAAVRPAVRYRAESVGYRAALGTDGVGRDLGLVKLHWDSSP